jgi:hypothetical protein
LLTLSGGDRDEGAKLLDSLNSRKGSLARFDITDAAAPPAAWLMALRLQYHTALELGDAHHAITILSSISHANRRGNSGCNSRQPIRSGRCCAHCSSERSSQG